jgi:hypothetical protein
MPICFILLSTYIDAKKNLSDAVIYACEGRAGVYVAFDGCIINGTHARKVKTRSYDAFESVNYPVVAHIKHSSITHNEAVQGDYNKSYNSEIEPELCSDELKKNGFLNMYACIACPKKEDEYLNRNSIEFHSHLGYRLVGEFYDCGYKFKRWYNMVWMEKLIGEHIDK